MDRSRLVTVQGTVSGDALPQDLERAVVRVQLQDVSLVDHPAQVLAETFTRPTVTGGRQLADYALPPCALDPRRDYSVWAHVDLDDDGRLSPGDLISTRSYPVRPSAATVHIDIEVSSI
jgi:uncharacterized lipoprotein YbaY